MKPDNEHRGIWKDFGYYTSWWCLWYAIGGLLTPTTGPGQMLPNVVTNILVGLVLAVVFTITQNMMNKSRKKWVSWVLAIMCSLAVKIVIYDSM